MNVPGVHIDINVCDEIAKRIHYPLDSPERIKAGMKYVLRAAMQSGNMFLYSSGKKGLVELVSKQIHVEGSEVAAVLNKRPKGFVLEQDKSTGNYRVYLDYAHKWEVGLAEKIHRFLTKKKEKIMDATEVESFLKKYQKENGFTLAAKQSEAVYALSLIHI